VPKCHLALAVAALAITAGAAWTQAPAPEARAAIAARADPPAWVLTEPAPPPSRLQFDGLLGFPTGVRGQVRLNNDPALAWLAEGFVGAEFVFPTVGVGYRWRINCWQNGSSSFAVGPGMDVYASYLYLGGAMAVAGDVDVVWNKRFERGGSFDLGMKAGVAPTFGKIIFNDDFRGILPVASVIVAWHF
jgi:hypothetical protein